jgi:hypothetical protein
MSSATELDDFLGHTSRERGAGVSRLRGWKKRDDRAINVCLHTRAAPVALWQHGIARVVTLEKDDETRREAWGDTWNCIEPEIILKKQYFRDKKTGERETPPTICPLCILIEWVRRMVEAGQMKFCEPLFKWVGDDESKARVITAAGIFNGYNARELTNEQKKAMRRADVDRRNAWKENAYAKCNYVFTVVDVDNVSNGVQVATETTLVGDKTKEVIRDAKMALGDEEGNPLLNPYAIRWEHRPDEREFNKKYKVIRMERIVVTDEITKLIVDEDPPDRSSIIRPGNVRKLRADLEAHALIDFPWDDIFGPAEQKLGIDHDADADDGADDDDDAPPAASSSGGGDAGPGDDEQIGCDVCEEPMAVEDLVCPKCGTEYDEKTGAIVKRGKVKRSRSTAKRRPKAPPAASSRGSSRGDDWPGDDDDIPF